MAGEFVEFFTELLFGSGAWIGLILICAIIILVTAKEKFGSVIFLPITVFMMIEYSKNVSTSSNFMWAIIIMGFMSIYCIIMLIKGIKE